jgi:hypothetical protein
MQQPPLLPEEALNRVLRTSRLNGLSVLIASAFFALVSALAKDGMGAVAGLVVAGSGAMEVHGGSLLLAGDRRGVRWLLWSQAVCLVGILVYCAVRLFVVQIPPLPDEMKPLIEFDAKKLGLTAEEFVLKSYRLGIFLVAGLSLLYQGGMAFYYARRRASVMRALSVLG